MIANKGVNCNPSLKQNRETAKFHYDINFPLMAGSVTTLSKVPNFVRASWLLL